MLLVLDVENPQQTRRMRRIIRRFFGPDAEMVFGEATDNALDHTEDRSVEVVLHAKRFHVRTPETPEVWITSKPEGLGGYGLGLIEALGGSMCTQDGFKVMYHR